MRALCVSGWSTSSVSEKLRLTYQDAMVSNAPQWRRGKLKEGDVQLSRCNGSNQTRNRNMAELRKGPMLVFNKHSRLVETARVGVERALEMDGSSRRAAQGSRRRWDDKNSPASAQVWYDNLHVLLCLFFLREHWRH